jgi:maleate isomerase
MSAPTRVGLVVPSSNTTIETEVPQMLSRRAAATGEAFTFHSSRAVLHTVDRESLDRMVGQVDRCANELADARVDAIVYACLVAVMARGPGEHEKVERQLGEAARRAGGDGYDPAISSSAGALVRSLDAHRLSKIAILTPYVEALTEQVVAYLTAAGLTVTEAMSLGVPDNVEVAKLDPLRLPDLAAQMDLSSADAVIISACVQMPSLAAIPIAERKLGLPVLSAATATVHDLLVRLGLSLEVPDSGALLSGSEVLTASA